MNHAYFSPSIPVNIFSLGHLQRCGATYGPDPLRQLTHVTVCSTLHGPLLAHAKLSSNNLLSVDFKALQLASTLNPRDYHNHRQATFPIPHINAEQRARADAAEQLHIDICHPSDRSPCSNISSGKLPFSTTLNRPLRGPCPHCTAGKHPLLAH